MAGTLGTITGQVRIDVKQAVAAYAALRAANVATILALRSASAAFIAAGVAIGGAGLAITAGFVYAIKAAADFERQMDFFGAVSNSTAAEMEAVKQKAIELGNATIFSAKQVAESFVELGKAGVSAKDIVEGVGEAVTSLGAAGDIPLADAAKIITAAIQTFALKATDAVHVADLLAGAANASIVEIDDLGVSLKYVGGVAAAISVPIEDTINAISLLGKAGIRGSTAGTSLRQILVSLSGTSKKAQKQLKELGIITEDGANKFFDAQGKAKPLGEIFQILQDHTKGLTEAQRLSAFKIIFNNRALAAAAILTRQGAAGFKAMNAEISKTTAADVAHKRLDNLSGDVERLKSALETLAIRAGGPFQNFLRSTVQLLTNLVNAFNALPPNVQSAVFVTLAITGAVLLLVGALSTAIGIMLRFASQVLLLRSAIMIIIRTLAALRVALIATWLAALGPVGLIIAAILAVVAVLVILYLKSETVRNIINAVGQAIVTAFQAVVDFFKGLPGFFAGVWSAVVTAFTAAKNAVVGAWQAVAAFFTGVWNAIVSGVTTAFNAVVGFFQALPGRLLTIVSALVTGIINYFKNLPVAVAYWIGYMWGLAIRLFLLAQQQIGNVVIAIINTIINFFRLLPGRLLAIWNAIKAAAVAAWNATKNAIISAAVATYNAVVNFFRLLPGRLAAIWNSIKAAAISAWNSLKSAVVNAARATYTGIVSFIQQLPGRLAALWASVKSGAINAWNSLKSTLVSIAKAIPPAIVGALSGLAGLLKDAVMNAIHGLGDLAGAAASEAKKVGGALWNGFKDGLGIHSPSFIEKAMFAIHDTMVDELAFLVRQVKSVQGLGQTLPTVQKSVAASRAAQNARIADLADTGIRVTTVKTTPTPGAATGAAAVTDDAKLRFVSGELTLTPDGKAFIQGIAEEVYDDQESYNASLGRMG